MAWRCIVICYLSRSGGGQKSILRPVHFLGSDCRHLDKGHRGYHEVYSPPSRPRIVYFHNFVNQLGGHLPSELRAVVSERPNILQLRTSLFPPVWLVLTILVRA